MPILINDQRRLTAAGLLHSGDAPMSMVKPLTSYMDGSKMRGPQDEPYRTNQAHAQELKEAGLAEIVGDEKKPAAEAPAAEAEDAAEAGRERDQTNQRRGRGRPRG
jgi:hypothetical protein